MPRPRKPANPFRYFHSSPEVIRLVLLMYVRFPLSLRNVEDLLFERGIDLRHERSCQATYPAHPLTPDVSRQYRPETIPPVPHRLVAKVDTALK